jgi:signal transduction histidine kinase
MSAKAVRPCRILVASGTEALRSLLGPLFAHQGYEMIGVKNGAAALQKLEADVILVDVNLPDLNAVQFLKQVQGLAPKKPVILLAGKEDIRVAVAAMKEGAQDCLIKPLRREEILRALRSAQEESSTQEQTPGDRQVHKLETLGRLTSAVAHDLNNQMTVILGYTQLLLNQAKAVEYFGEDLAEIHRAADQAASLTRQLLDFSRKQEPVVRYLQLNALVAGMEKMLRHLLGEKIAVTLDLRAHQDRVRADPSQIAQVIMNLVLNARDAMPGGGRLTLATANDVLEAPSGVQVPARLRPCVNLVVTDTGCGMDATTLAHLFEPFFTTKPQGTGQGLIIIQKIVAESGGQIKVKSLPRQGTTFTISLPQVTAAPEPQPEPAPAYVDLPGGSETILMVEDNTEVRAMLRAFLRRQGYTVLEAESGFEALQVSEHHGGPLQLLLTDVVLPQMPGPELAKGVASVHPEVRVLFMSGYNARNLLEHGIKDPGGAFIQKPFTTDALAKLIRNLLDS